MNVVEGESARLLEERFSLRVRCASWRDAHCLAVLHIKAGANQVGAFLPKLGLRFLTRYYRLLLTEQNTLVLCAVDAGGEIIGFVSGTLRTEDHFVNLYRKRLGLLMAVNPLALMRPSILAGLWWRSRIAFSKREGRGFVVKNGCRVEYWAWDPVYQHMKGSVLLLLAFFDAVRSKGVRTVRMEVDEENKGVMISHLLLGAKVIARSQTLDGRNRLILEYQWPRDTVMSTVL